MEKWNKIIDLKSDAASSEVINDRILSDMTICGANLIILVTAIIIACVGLNLNSTAVIIGAMLVSPLMGNILAAGYGMATYDTNFIRKALINMIFQVVFALLTATVYFFSRRHCRCYRQYKNRKEQCYSRRSHCYSIDAPALYSRIRYCGGACRLFLWGYVFILYKCFFYSPVSIFSIQNFRNTSTRQHS